MKNNKPRKSVKFKLNLFQLLDDLDGWNYFDQIVEWESEKLDDLEDYLPSGSYKFLSPLKNDELEWETELIHTDSEYWNPPPIP